MEIRSITKCLFRFAFSHLLINYCSRCGKLLQQKLSAYYDDVTTNKNNRQVCVNVGTMLVAIFCIGNTMCISIS